MCGPNGSFQYNCPTTDSDDQIARRNSRRPSNEYTAVAGRCYLSWRSATSWHEVLGRTLEPLDRFHIELWLSQVELHRWRSASKTNKSKQILAPRGRSCSTSISALEMMQWWGQTSQRGNPPSKVCWDKFGPRWLVNLLVKLLELLVNYSRGCKWSASSGALRTIKKNEISTNFSV